MKKGIEILNIIRKSNFSYDAASEKSGEFMPGFTSECPGSEAYDEIFEILRGNDDETKAFAVLNLEEIRSEEDLTLLVKHLTNCDGKLREIVSMKLIELTENKNIKLYGHFPILINALCDVNPNVARNIVSLIGYAELGKLNIDEKIIEKIEEILAEIEEKSKPVKWKTQKNHALNKKFFNLYWCLEALSMSLCGKTDNEKLIKILYRCSDFHDYTIREKVAKILVKMHTDGSCSHAVPEDLLQKMKNDDNFYVKLCFCDKILE